MTNLPVWYTYPILEDSADPRPSSAGHLAKQPASPVSMHPDEMRATIARQGKEICREEKPGSIVLDKIERRECYSCPCCAFLKAAAASSLRPSFWYARAGRNDA